MNKEINFETAKLLKEKGFDKSTEANWWILAKDHLDNYENKLPIDESKIFFAKDLQDFEDKIAIDGDTPHDVFHFLSVPTIATVVMWLYENHGVWIYTKRSCEIINDEAFDKLTPVIEFIPQSQFDVDNMGNFNTPTEAYEAGITYTLENLI